MAESNCEVPGGTEEVVEALNDLPSTEDLEDPSLPHPPKPFEDFYQGGSVTITHPDDIPVRWDDLTGLHNAKLILKEKLMMPFKFPHLFEGRVSNEKNVLLYGPPGCGKSMLMKALAKESCACLMTVNSYSMMSRMVTDRAQFVRAVFACAAANHPCIILIEDIEVFIEEENTEAREVLFQLMSTKLTASLPVIAMTRFPWLLYKQMGLRSSFPTLVYVPIPDKTSRNLLFKMHLNIQPAVSEEEFEELAKRTEGYTVSDILVLVRDAAMEPVREIQRATHFRLERHQSEDKPDEIVDMETACLSSDPGAQAKSWMDIGPDTLYVKPITMDHLWKCLSRCKSCMRSDELDLYKKFTEDGRS
ncbi:vacuolar protein sorting-associated protein 4B-like [Ylistrum balloti]|uniref:vacuolar protein sorting-associated protein 4B-like n=1 Tax=Ylistrum balloti TaxID=509963 RepID=UPI002905AAF1|nr:vacuolar protein sorting-associated protein 4B-like [Ylistrum balloti]